MSPRLPTKKLGAREEHSIEFETRPAPDWVQLDGWVVRGIIPGGTSVDDRYLLACSTCGYEARWQVARINRYARTSKTVACRGCNAVGKTGETRYANGRCKRCEDMPWCRPHPVCDCGKRYAPEVLERPDVSLVGSQLANAWEWD